MYIAIRKKERSYICMNSYWNVRKELLMKVKSMNIDIIRRKKKVMSELKNIMIVIVPSHYVIACKR